MCPCCGKNAELTDDDECSECGHPNCDLHAGAYGEPPPKRLPSPSLIDRIADLEVAIFGHHKGRGP